HRRGAELHLQLRAGLLVDALVHYRHVGEGGEALLHLHLHVEPRLVGGLVKAGECHARIGTLKSGREIMTARECEGSEQVPTSNWVEAIVFSSPASFL